QPRARQPLRAGVRRRGGEGGAVRGEADAAGEAAVPARHRPGVRGDRRRRRAGRDGARINGEVSARGPRGPTMTKLFNEDGVSFRYPADWTLEREDGEHGWTVSLQSPDTAFAVISCDEKMPETEEVAEAVLEALQADYPDLEAEPCVDTLAGRMAVGHDI